MFSNSHFKMEKTGCDAPALLSPYMACMASEGLVVSHEVKRPRLHEPHPPHAMSKHDTTRSPTCTRASDGGIKGFEGERNRRQRRIEGMIFTIIVII